MRVYLLAWNTSSNATGSTPGNISKSFFLLSLTDISWSFTRGTLWSRKNLNINTIIKPNRQLAGERKIVWRSNGEKGTKISMVIKLRGGKIRFPFQTKIYLYEIQWPIQLSNHQIWNHSVFSVHLQRDYCQSNWKKINKSILCGEGGI